VTGASLRAAAAALAVTTVTDPERRYHVAPDADLPPPRRLTSVPGKPHYHPSCLRVGVRVNGAERSDLIEYDQDAGTAKTRNDAVISGTIEPFWRYEESRQERRGRERWEQKHGRSR
jgi:hypothetical protein